MRRRSPEARGQTMVEFSLLLPLFLLVIFSTIDFSGYFGARLSVENAARAGARVATTTTLADYTSGTSPQTGSGIISTVLSNAADAAMPSNVDCVWNGTTLSPTSYPPFTWSSGKGCIGIWYFELEKVGPPQLCTQFSATHLAFGSYSGSTWTAAAPVTGCVAADSDVVVIGVGYSYSPLTPIPALSGLVTYGETQLLEED
jgi:hypothetical protein